ncbi:MAG TPA: hypothetical protein VF865_04065 [Acidobacteriaceae bacterium]
MSKPLSESVLARLTDPTRAAAIIGDLEELAATRSRLWFWTTYVGTLILLGWRTPVALVCSAVCMSRMAIALTKLKITLMHHGGSWIYARTHPQTSSFTWIFCWFMVRALSFALPFVLIRFGLRNRLTQLACALLLITLPIYMLGPLPGELSTILCVLAIAAAFLLPPWRRPMIVLAATCIPVVAMNPLFHLWFLYAIHIKQIPIAVFTWGSRYPATHFLYEMTAFLLAAIVCSYLYRRLLPHRSVIA